MKISTRLVLTSFITTLIIGVLAVGLIYFQTGSTIKQDVEVRTEQLTDYNYEIIDNYVSGIKARLITLAKDKEVIEYLKTRDESLFNQVTEKIDFITENDVFFEGLSIDNNDCILIVSRTAAKSILGMDFSDRDYCKGIKETKEPYVSSAFLSANTGNSVLAVSVPINNEQGEMIGFVNGIVNFVGIKDSFLKLQAEEKDRNIILLDRYGNVFLDTKREITEISSDYGEELEVGLVNQKLEQGETEGFFEYFDDEDKLDEFVAYKKFDYVTIIINQPVSTAFALTGKLSNLMILITLIAVILIAGSIFFISRSISKPIKKLSNNVDEISRGNFKIDIEKSNIQEIDALAESLKRVMKTMKLAVLEKGPIKEKQIKPSERISAENISKEKLRKFMKGPVEKEKPDEEKAKKVVVNRLVKGAKSSAEKPVEKSATKPAEKTIKKPELAKKSVAKPVEKSIVNKKIEENKSIINNKDQKEVKNEKPVKDKLSKTSNNKKYFLKKGEDK